jgi:hypothetical protein
MEDILNNLQNIFIAPCRVLCVGLGLFVLLSVIRYSHLLRVLRDFETQQTKEKIARRKRLFTGKNLKEYNFRRPYALATRIQNGGDLREHKEITEEELSALKKALEQASLDPLKKLVWRTAIPPEENQ